MIQGRLHIVNNLNAPTFAVNLYRASLLIQNDCILAIRVGFDNTVSAVKGVRLDPCNVDGSGGGMYAFDDYTGAVYLFVVGGDGWINYVEFTR